MPKRIKGLWPSSYDLQTREAKARRNTAQTHYENLQKIPLTPGVSDFSFPTATPHWWYGLRELKEVSVEFK